MRATGKIACLLTWLLAVCGSPLLAAPTQLIPPDATWSYHIVTDVPPDGWMAQGFDDASWRRGIAGFSIGHFSYAQAATDLTADAAEPPATGLLLRTVFRIDDPAAIAVLLLRIEFEDGLRVWLNGTEVIRRGYPADDPFSLERPPDPHPPSAAELLDLASEIPLLVRGTNLLAIEVRDVPGGIAPSLFAGAEVRANFSRGPFLQNVASNQATLVWQTPPPLESWVEIARDGEEESAVIPGLRSGTETVAWLTNLVADTGYKYRVGVRVGLKVTYSEFAEFRTHKPAGDIDFLVVGDTGSGRLVQIAVARRMAQQPTDLVLHTGDLVYPTFSLGRADLRCFSLYEPWMRQGPLYTTPGNHEVYGSMAEYLEAFWLPTNSVSGSETFYSFDHGDVHFVSLYLPWWGLSGLGPLPDGTASPAFRWLVDDLASTSRPWKVVFFHQPPLSSGPHVVDDYDVDGQADFLPIRQILLPLLAAHGVQLVFNGHDHIWERFAPTNGTHFVITGGGGGIIYQPTPRQPGSARVMARPHLVRARVRKEQMLVEAIDPSGEVFDQFVIGRSGTAEDAFSAAWHTPESSVTAASNGDGNRLGERFDFAGQGHSAIAGRSANLGQLWINNDDERVHLGLRDVMLWPGQTIALLIGAEGASGVTNLQTAGSSRDHPLSRVDLSFSGFQPRIICLLGDEMADGTFPDFIRPGTELSLGQGAFLLDPDLPVATGVSISQFNRSPETVADPAEQSADFIIVSIPRGQLGDIGPGSTIFVAAMVFMPGSSANGVGLQLDSGCIGRRLTMEGTTAFLEPLTVTLAAPVFEVTAKRVEGDLVLSWRATIGKAYDIEFTERLEAGFASLELPEFPRVATSPREEVRLKLGEHGETARWFRVHQVE